MSLSLTAPSNSSRFVINEAVHVVAIYFLASVIGQSRLHSFTDRSFGFQQPVLTCFNLSSINVRVLVHMSASGLAMYRVMLLANIIAISKTYGSVHDVQFFCFYCRGQSVDKRTVASCTYAGLVK